MTMTTTETVIDARERFAHRRLLDDLPPSSVASRARMLARANGLKGDAIEEIGMFALNQLEAGASPREAIENARSFAEAKRLLGEIGVRRECARRIRWRLSCNGPV